MNNVLLCALLVVSVIGAVFTTIVALGVGSMCQKAQEDIEGLKKSLEKIQDELERSNEFDQAVTDCINGIGNALEVINERTNWLDGVNDQISDVFGQNKDGNKS